MEIVPLLRQLSETNGISGYEDPIRDLLRKTWRPYVDGMEAGKLGSLIGLKRGSGPEPRPRVMLAAHMDEIGLMVTGIEDGFLRVTQVGGIDRRVLLGLEVTVHGQRDLPGIVATRPPHVLPPKERTRVVPWDQIFVDVGLAEEEVEESVSVGDPITFRHQLVELQKDYVAAKALDDRAGVAVMTLVLEHLSRVEHAWDVIAAATVQEEVGLRGAIVTAYGSAPDLAVVFDTTCGKQSGVSETDSFPLNEGPTLGIGPNFHPQVLERLKSVARSHEIPYQIEATPGRSGTDAWAIQVARQGVPTALIGLPLRYMHQPVEVVCTSDVQRAVRLTGAFVAGLEPDFLESLARGLMKEGE